MKHTLPLLTLGLALLAGPLLVAQTARNTHPTAALEVESTTKGFLPPRMSTIQRDAISAPAVGLTIFNLNTHTLEVFTGFGWKQLSDGISGFNTVVSASGQIWMDRNLGATQVATSSTDADAYGWFYQWGRNSDGHQARDSSTAAGPVADGDEGSNFITTSSSPHEWLSTLDPTRWNGATKGIHDPCPEGFRVPTETELVNEFLVFSPRSTVGAFASLKLVASGRRIENGSINSEGTSGFYWSTTLDGNNKVKILVINTTNSFTYTAPQSFGLTVRCIKE
jgi:hypothetical protein